MRLRLLAALIGYALVMSGYYAGQASAAEPKAGKFWREGMSAMYEIGIRMPFEGNASMTMLGCKVTDTKAECRLKIKQQGLPWCTVRVLLTRRHVAYPASSWHCPREWRPVYMPDIDRLKTIKPTGLSVRVR